MTSIEPVDSWYHVRAELSFYYTHGTVLSKMHAIGKVHANMFVELGRLIYRKVTHNHSPKTVVLSTKPLQHLQVSTNLSR